MLQNLLLEGIQARRRTLPQSLLLVYREDMVPLPGSPAPQHGHTDDRVSVCVNPGSRTKVELRYKDSFKPAKRFRMKIESRPRRQHYGRLHFEIFICSPLVWPHTFDSLGNYLRKSYIVIYMLTLEENTKSSSRNGPSTATTR